MGLATDFVADERANGLTGFESAMSSEENLDAGPMIGLLERERNGSQFGSKFFVR